MLKQFIPRVPLHILILKDENHTKNILEEFKNYDIKL